MPATVTLSTTTLSEAIGAHDGTVKLASTSGLFKGYRLFIDGEMLEVISLGVGVVNVRRGIDGTRGAAHHSGATVYIGQAHQFYQQDPTGRPPLQIPVSPYINSVNGSVWFAQGDATEGAARWWQRAVTTYGTGALGVRTSSVEPSSST